MTLTIEVLGEAVPKGRPRAFNTPKGIRMHTPSRTAAYETQVRLIAQEAINQELPGTYPLQGPVALRVVVFRGAPKSLSRKVREAALQGMFRPTTRPDLDNIVKCIKDALNGVAWRDDSQIVELGASKSYATQPMCRIIVAEVNHGNGG